MWALPQPLVVNVSSSYSNTTTPELRMFFHGRNVDNRNRVDPASGGGGPARLTFLAGVGYANFRFDGLQGLHAGYGEAGRGVATTKLLTIDPTNASIKYHLVLNVDCGAGGVLYVEIQGEDGIPVPGFTRQDAMPIATNSLELVAEWQNSGHGTGKPLSDLRLLAGKGFRLRFELEDATLYSFQIRSVPWPGVAQARVKLDDDVARVTASRPSLVTRVTKVGQQGTSHIKTDDDVLFTSALRWPLLASLWNHAFSVDRMQDLDYEWSCPAPTMMWHSERATRTVYLSQTENDFVSGFSEDAPWKTLAKLSTVELGPGDTVLLQAGDTWVEPMVLQGSGPTGAGMRGY